LRELHPTKGDPVLPQLPFYGRELAALIGTLVRRAGESNALFAVGVLLAFVATALLFREVIVLAPPRLA
jgi:hypothetical protein